MSTSPVGISTSSPRDVWVRLVGFAKEGIRHAFHHRNVGGLAETNIGFSDGMGEKPVFPG